MKHSNVPIVAVPLFVLALAPSAGAGQAMYKSLTPDGKVVYSDRPPANAKLVKEIKAEKAPLSALPASAAERLRKLEALRAPPAPDKGVVLYAASWCGYCRKAKAYLEAKGIAYREIDIETPEGLAAFARDGGGKGVPVLRIGKTRVDGFSVEAYDAALADR